MAKNIIKATSVVLVINLIVKLLGFLRETFIAGAFGASDVTDAYLSAYTLPYFLQAILGAALVAVMVPVLTNYLVKGEREEAWHVASSVLNITALLLAVLSLLGILLADLLVALLTPGFGPAQAATTAHLARIMFPSVLFMGLGMVITGILNANQRFAIPAFAPGFSNLIIIATVVLFAGRFGVDGLAVGTLISFVGLLLIQVPLLKGIGFRYTLVMDWKHPGVRKVLHDIIPIVLGVAVNQIYFAVNRIFASGLAEGTISNLNYANKVMMLPVGIFAAAVVAVIYPSLSEHAIKRDGASFANGLKKGLGLVSLIAWPATFALILLRVPVIQLLFERGAFDHQATLATANALLYFCIGLWPMAVNMVLTRAFYAYGDVKTPLYMGFLSIIVNVILCLALYRLLPFGGAGLAFANSVAAVSNMLLLYWALRKHLPQLPTKALLTSNARILLATLLMSVGVALVWSILAGLKIALLVKMVVIVCVGVALYVVGVFLFKVDEAQYFKEIVNRKLGRSKGK